MLQNAAATTQNDILPMSQACHAICRLSPLDAAQRMRFTKKKRAARHECASPATQKEDGHVQSAAPTTPNESHFLKTLPKYCACHTIRLSRCYAPCWNVTKCHACHAKRALKPAKVTAFAELAKGTVIATSREQLRTVADGCGRLRTVAQRLANTPSTPKPP